jgi:hypothetical protein
MRVERGGTGEYMFIDIGGPPGWSTATVTAEIAIVTPDKVPAAGDGTRLPGRPRRCATW